LAQPQTNTSRAQMMRKGVGLVPDRVGKGGKVTPVKPGLLPDREKLASDKDKSEND